jgi:RNA polymerase sigma factor (sigma-70 family)
MVNLRSDRVVSGTDGTGKVSGTDKDRRAFVDAVAAQHGQRLRRFLHARVRNAADASDLVQEVYLRLLRVDNHETIRMPEAYVFALANHVLYQYRLRQSRTLQPSELIDAMAEAQSAFENDPLIQSETQQRIQELETVLSDLSPKARATLIMHRRDGLTLEQIGHELGVSRPMAKKYLAKALLRCRQALDEKE